MDSTNISYKEKADKRIILVFIIQLIALGGAVDGFMSHSVKMNSWENCILPIALLYYLSFSNIDLKKIKALYFVLSVITISQIAVIYKYGTGNILIGRYYDVIIAFVLLRSLGIDRFFFYFENSVTILVKISLLLWGVCLLFPMLCNILVPLSLPIGFPTCSFTWGFVGLANLDSTEGLVLRNLGFAWEPGRFSSILVVTLMIHLFRNRFNLFRKNFVPLLLGIISSQATTGYMAFSVCLLGLLVNSDKKRSSKLVKYSLCGIFCIVLFCSPFMLEKMKQILDPEYFLNSNNIERLARTGEQYVPQRAEGLLMEFMNVADSPWIGYGDFKGESYISRELFPTIDIALSNGILQIFAMLGIPIGLLLYWALYKSSTLLASHFKVKGGYLFFLVICAVNVSYNFFVEPFFMVIILYCLFERKDRLCVN